MFVPLREVSRRRSDDCVGSIESRSDRSGVVVVFAADAAAASAADVGRGGGGGHHASVAAAHATAAVFESIPAGGGGNGSCLFDNRTKRFDIGAEKTCLIRQ